MKNLIPDDQIPRTEHANEVWSQEQDDALLNDYLSGGSPGALAAKHKRKPKAITRRIDYYRDNERDWVVNYKPGPTRQSRKGKRLTSNEKLIIAGHRAKKIAPYLTARVLAREVSEIEDHDGQVREVKNLAALAPKLDLIWAYRYIYLIYKLSLISDKTYDDLVEEEIEYGGGTLAFEGIKKHQGWPIHIRSLAGYLTEKQKALAETAVTYALGERDEDGNYGLVSSLKEARSFDGKSARSRIFELKGGIRRAIARWDPKQMLWEMRP